MQKTILVCDDHDLFLGGMAEILNKFGENYKIITFNNSVSCIKYIQQNKVEVFICDLNIDHTDGFALIGNLKKELTQTKIIILTAYFEDFLIQKAMKLGIHAFMRKESTAEELITIIESDNKSMFYANGIFENSTDFFKVKDACTIGKFRLSKQEKEIIKLIIDGKTSNQIASLLNISKTTVDTHRKNINRKLEISNSSSLIKFAHENNLFA